MTNPNEITFGVELETIVPVGAVAVGTYRRGNAIPGFPTGWAAHSDSSIRSRAGYVGCEFVSPILRGADGVRQVLAVVAKIRELGGRVNVSCGLHVHVGFSGDDKAMKRLVTLVANFEKAIYASTGTKSREQGHWAASVQSHGDAQSAQNAASHQRYHLLNLTNIARGVRPAVEFRAFAGTLNETKIVGHIQMCLGIVQRAIEAKRVTAFVAKTPEETSPIKRGGEGQTALNRLCYQLGWTKGRSKKVFGVIACDEAPSLKEVKKELHRLAKKYDAQ